MSQRTFALVLTGVAFLFVTACSGTPGMRDSETMAFETCVLFGAYDENMKIPSLFMDKKYGPGLGRAAKQAVAGTCDTDCFQWGECTPEVKQAVYDEWSAWRE